MERDINDRKSEFINEALRDSRSQQPEEFPARLNSGSRDLPAIGRAAAKTVPMMLMLMSKVIPIR